MTDHVLAAQIIARDTALSHALDEQMSSVAEQGASLERAYEEALNQRRERFTRLAKYMEGVLAAEDEAAQLEFLALTVTLQNMMASLAKLRDQVRSGEALMPVAAQLSAPKVDPERLLQGAPGPAQDITADESLAAISA